MQTKKCNKKQIYGGQKNLVDPETGEVIPCQIQRVEERDFNFHKLWFEHFVQSIDSITNKKLQLAFWIIKHLNRDNQLIATQRKISDETGMALDTVARTLKALQSGNPAFLVKINAGAYMVNPDIIYKGSYTSRMAVMFDYSQALEEQYREQAKAAEAEAAAEEEAKQVSLDDELEQVTAEEVLEQQEQQEAKAEEIKPKKRGRKKKSETAA